MAKATTSATSTTGRATSGRSTDSTRKERVPARKSSRAGGKKPVRSGADWDAAKDILAAHRTLARAERREADLADGLKIHTKTLRALDKQSAALAKSLARASEDLQTASSTRRKVAKKLHKLESARPKK